MIFPDSKDRANLFLAGDEYDQALGEIATCFHQRVSQGHREDAAKQLDKELVTLTAGLPDRAAIQCLASAKLYELIESTPADPVHDGQIRKIRALPVASIKQPSSDATAAFAVATGTLGKNEEWYSEALHEFAGIKEEFIKRLPEGFSKDPAFSKTFTDFLVQFAQASEIEGDKPEAFELALNRLGKTIVELLKKGAPRPKPVAPTQKSNP